MTVHEPTLIDKAETLEQVLLDFVLDCHPTAGMPHQRLHRDLFLQQLGEQVTAILRLYGGDDDG